jgi:phosphoribosyl 1,2-cyclic phosphodiesterase
VYGGNTSCVEVRFGEAVFICDAGSGIRELGKDLVARTPRPQVLHLLITHTHWDHIQGFPFFAPAYFKELSIRVYGQSAEDQSRYQLLSGQMSSEYFPVSFADLGGQIVSDHLEGGRRVIEGVEVKSFPLNHPGGCCGYVLQRDGVKIVYATDNELELQPGDTFPDNEHQGALRKVPSALVEVVRDADLLILDAQFDDDQYAAKKGWGHSTCFSATDLGIQAKVKHLVLFHHDPESTDRDLDARIVSCQARVAKHGARMTVSAAREGVELKF